MAGSCVGGDCPTAIQFTLGGQEGVLVQGERVIGGEQARALNALHKAGVGTSDTETQVWIPLDVLRAAARDLLGLDIPIPEVETV